MDAIAYRKMQDESVRLIDGDDYEAATPLAKKSLAAAKRLFGESHFETADCLYNLGSIERLTGKWKKGITTLEKAMAIYEALGPDKRYDVARTLGDIANVLVSHGEYARARPLATRSIAEYRALAIRDDDYACALGDLARCDYEDEHWEAAVAGYEEALAIRSDLVEQLFDSKCCFGVALMDVDRDRAAKIFDEALVLAEKLSPSQHILALLNVAACATKTARAKDGEKPAQLALDIARRIDSKREIAAALFRRADVHVCLGEHAQAVPLLEQGVEIQKKTKDDATWVDYLRLLGMALNGAGLHKRAARWLARAHPIAKRRASEAPDIFDDVEYELVEALYEDDEPLRAKPWAEARVARLAHEQPESNLHVNAIERLALVLDEIDEEKDAARTLYQRVIELREKAGGDDDGRALAWQNLGLHATSRDPPDWAMVDDAYDHVLALAPATLDEILVDLGADLEHCPRVAARARATGR
jgi:tetratricopeptide (TPR) repeat protein